jgi:hypothetical protein
VSLPFNIQPSGELFGELQNLSDATAYFSDEMNCVRYIAMYRWPDGVVKCPVCGESRVRFLALRGIWECTANHQKNQFSVRAGTLFEDSHIPLGDWLVAIWIVANAAKPVSSYRLAAAINITQKSAWFMLKRIGATLDQANCSVDGLNQEVYGSNFAVKSRVQASDS